MSLVLQQTVMTRQRVTDDAAKRPPDRQPHLSAFPAKHKQCGVQLANFGAFNTLSNSYLFGYMQLASLSLLVEDQTNNLYVCDERKTLTPKRVTAKPWADTIRSRDCWEMCSNNMLL